MAGMDPERKMRWYRRSAAVYALSTWAVFCGLSLSYWSEKRRRRPPLGPDGGEGKHLDRNAVWITPLTPLGYFVLPKYEWNYVFPKEQRDNAEKPFIATSVGRGPETTDPGH